jgi:D-arabinitol dehydrogenase (NADP+)
MKALYYKKAGDGSICDIPEPMCGDNDVIIQVKACGICIHVEEDHANNGTPLSKYPVVPGHEFSGVVSKIGKNVTTVKVGERVTADNTSMCGICYYCKKGDDNHCNVFGSLGHNINGGFAEYVLVNEGKVYKIPDNVSFNAATLSEPIACCIHCIDRCVIKFGENVAVFGAGPNGLILSELANHSNAAKVVTVASSKFKLDVLNKHGYTTIQMDRSDYSKHESKLMEMFPNGIDLIIDATGSAQVIENAFKLLRKGGRLVQYSYIAPGTPVKIDPYLMFMHELTYSTACCQTHNFDRALVCLGEGKVHGEDYITHTFTLDNYFTALETNLKDRNAIKVIVNP